MFRTRKLKTTKLNTKTCPRLLHGPLLTEFMRSGTARKTAHAQIMHLRGFIP